MEPVCRCSGAFTGGGSSFNVAVPSQMSAPAADQPDLAATLSALSTVIQQLIYAVQSVASGASLSPAAAVNDANNGVRIATFNTLGGSHTDGGNQHPTWASGVDRTPGMIATLKSRNVDVAGLQEFQSSQRKAFKRAAPGYDMYTQGSTSIVWKQDRFRLVSSRAVTMPYFGGKPAKRPIVQLEDRTTGKRMWVMNIHNPADVRQHQNQGKFRTEALRRELEIVEQLRKDGLPVFLVGDFNNGERARDVLTAGSELTASDPIGGDTQIDWVFGAGHQGFTSHEVDRSTQSSRISDHPLVVATAQL